MADPRFFINRGPLSLGQLAEIGEVRLGPDADEATLFDDVAPLDTGGARDVSFLDNPRYLEQFANSKAGACVVQEKHISSAPRGMALLITDKPYRAYARIAAAFYPKEPAAVARHGSAVIDESARIADGVAIGPGVVIGPEAELGAGVRVGANAVIGGGVVIGEDTSVGANATLSHCLIGARVLIHPGVCIGQRGFGFDMAAEGHLDVPQLGRVIIEDDVEIGANSTIDRGAGPDTIVGAGCKIDNLVQIGHNVRLGRGCVIVAQAGLSGSANLEDFVVIAGQAGVAGHITLGQGVQLAARSGIMRDTPAGTRLAGNPAIPAREFFRQTAVLAKLATSRKG